MSEERLPFLEFDGQNRVFGCLPPKPDFGGFKASTAISDLIPRNKWFETPDDDFGIRVLDQGSHGSCVGHGSTSAFEMQWLRQGGDPVDFAACFVYGLINHNRDAGAIVSDAIEELEKTGVCTEKFVPPGTIYQRQFPKGAWTEAAKYKVKNSYHVNSFDAICSDILRGRTISHGIMVGANYADLDSNGIAPLPRGGGGGHCQYSYCLKNINGQWVIKTGNSWGKRFGMNGFCYLTEKHFDRPGQVDAFSIEFVDPTADVDQPQPMVV